MTRQQLIEHIRAMKSFLCVGLDPDLDKIPKHLLQDADPLFAFCKDIVDATHIYCVSFKPNTAFFEAYGAKGFESLARLVVYIKKYYPNHFVIADAKRGDIGNTSGMYARAMFEHLKADAVTVAPYMGSDSVKPFLAHQGKWAIVLGLTSNDGASDFQTQPLASDKKLFELVLETSKNWGNSENMMYVIGATKAESLGDVRKIIPDHFLLIPGVGAQGGSLEEVCRYGLTKDIGLLVNSSRQIIYASAGPDFAQRAAEEASKVQEQMLRWIN